MLETIKCNVNGRDYELNIKTGESLIDLLRNQLGLTSVKQGCEVGECGACTVLIDGAPVTSCIYLASWVNNKSVITVEGLEDEATGLSVVQRAFVDEAAVQCGFCTPGLILTGTALVNEKIAYTEDELREKIAGHLCRCTGYENIIRAVKKAIDVSLQNK